VKRRDQSRRGRAASEAPPRRQGKLTVAVRRFLIFLFLVALTANAMVANKSPERAARANGSLTDLWRSREAAYAVQIPRGSNGEFSVQARINGVAAPMVIDTGATSVVLTYETAKEIGLPLELLEYNVDVQTAGGHTKAARLWLDRLAVGKLTERSVPALVVPQGQMKTNLLGMSFLDRLESFEVRADQLMLRGFQEPVAFHSDRRNSALN
jgi:aspartyl protease family protein